MSNPEQAVPIDLMIRRLEEANARARGRGAHLDERVSETEQDPPPDLSDQQKSAAVPASRGWLALTLVGLVSAASLGAVAFVLKPSYFNAAKLTVARALAEVAPQTTPAPISPELAQRFQAMTRDFANIAQGIEQLRTSQEQMVRDSAAVAVQLKATLSQMTRDNTAVSDQLKATLSQMTRDNAAVVQQLKATQEQMVRLTATRARRKPEPTLPQAEARPQAPIYSPPPKQQ
jgi:hypothetical protein